MTNKTSGPTNNGKSIFTAREVECITQILKGKSPPEIGEELDIAENTVHFYLRNTVSKLGVLMDEIQTLQVSNEQADKETVKCRVLLVEDSLIAQKIQGNILREIGCPFDIAENAQQALQMMFDANAQANYDLILMDIGLGEGMNGFELSAQIRQYENGKNIRIIVVSATAEDELREECLAAHVDGFINKPVRIEKLRRML